MIDNALALDSFVLFKLPDAEKIELWHLQEDAISNSKFIFHSFDNSRHIELFALDKKEISLAQLDQLKLSLNLQTKGFPHVMSQEEYMEKADDFIAKLQTGYLDKIILSRVKEEAPITHIEDKFAHLCNKYPGAWVYLFYHNHKTWLGASPERLLLSKDRGYETVALAATKSKAENRDWTAKEYKEHQFVVDYITSKFPENAIEKNGPYTIDLGEIMHLKTDIRIVDTSLDLHQILENLHPTPAVCGMPKEKSMQYILDKEGYDRSFYTGYFGIETPTHTEFNVNLRCAQLFKDKTAVYVGGGLVAESNAESEWNETQLKSRALF